MSIASNFFEHLCQRYPGLKSELTPEHISPQLLSPYEVSLSAELNQNIEKTIDAFNTLFESHSSKMDKTPFHAGNRGLFMSYDFHVTEDGNLKLIEINTNASFLGLGFEFSQMKRKPWNRNFSLQDLKSDFENEVRLIGKSLPIQKVLITDESPAQQKLYAEFLLYRELIRSFGWSCEIVDVNDVTECDLIYNRSTDFYFTQPQSKKLLDLYQSKKTAISPQPHEYFVCADKSNFVTWSDDSFWNKVALPAEKIKHIRSCIPKTILFTAENVSEIWSNRKNLFFKPKNSFGSKMSYKGGSISRKTFDELLNNEALAQELVNPQELEFEGQKFKYDLRCYAYAGKYYGCMARLYQGQVTNLKTLNGGFATVYLT